MTDLQEHRASATPASLWHEINEAIASDPGAIQRRVGGEGAGVKRKQQLGAWERRAPAPANSQAGVAGPAGKARRVGREHSSGAHSKRGIRRDR